MLLNLFLLLIQFLIDFPSNIDDFNVFDDGFTSC